MSPKQSQASQPRRAADQAQISISLPRELLDLVDEAAQKEHRNRSNFIATALYSVLESQSVTDTADESAARKKKKKK